MKVKVLLRIRPLLPSEHLSRHSIAYNDQIVQMGSEKRQQFTLDGILPPSISQTKDDLYSQQVETVLKYCLEVGYNCTIFAYGQTGSGKTHTMFGDPFDSIQMGIIPRLINQIFSYDMYSQDDNIEEQTHESASMIESCQLSFLEIYCETIYDLLKSDTNSKIQIRESSNGDIHVSNLSTYDVTDASHALKLVRTGFQNRSTTATSAHLHSSRSHAILQLNIKTKFQKKIKISLVDLAGSERLKKTKLDTGGSGFQEAIKINSGLLSLANVIRSLSSSSSILNNIDRTSSHQSLSHVPYRQSKLTRFLKDGLGGDSITLMIACISPSHFDFPESLNTVSYAARARNIRNRPIVHDLIPIEDEIETLIGSNDEEYQDDFEVDENNEKANGEVFKEEVEVDIDSESIDKNEMELLRLGMLMDEKEWMKPYMTVLRSKTLQLTNANSLNVNLSEKIKELEDKLEQSLAYIQKLVQQQVNSQHEAVSSMNQVQQEESVKSESYGEYLNLKRTLKEKEAELAALYTDQVNMDAQIQQIHEAYQTRIGEIQNETEGRFKTEKQELEKDNYYYRQANKDLKDKLRSFMSLQKRQNEELKRAQNIQRENEDLKQLVRNLQIK